MFDMKAVNGNAVRALDEPFAMVITRSMSEKLFGRKDPVGQRLVINSGDSFWVRAVIEDLLRHARSHRPENIRWFDYTAFKQEQYDRLAEHIRQNVDLPFIYRSLQQS